MRSAMKNQTLLVPCLLFMFFNPPALAEDSITILEHSIKPVAAVPSGRYIETAWKVKLCNESDNPVTCVITIFFKDKNEDSLKKTKKEIELEGHEVNTYSDTVLLRSSIVSEIVSTDISVQVK